MKRRVFLTAAVIAMLPLTALAGGITIEYDRSDPIKAALKAGKTVMVDYAAEWCSTCQIRQRVIGSLRGENPAYEDIVFVRVDWDRFAHDPVARDHNIPRRSTLIVLKGNKELGRIVASTSRSSIKKLMDKALAAAQTS